MSSIHSTHSQSLVVFASRPIVTRRIILRESLGAGTTASAKTSKDGQRSEQSPDEEAKGDSSLGYMASKVAEAVCANVGGESDRSSEPEKCSETRETEANDGMV